MTKKLLLVAAVLIVLIAAWYFLIYKPGKITSIEGLPCRIGPLFGTYKNGVCTLPAPKELTVSFNH